MTLVYYEVSRNVESAIGEKNKLSGSRSRKIRLINNMNPTWDDLMMAYIEILAFAPMTVEHGTL